MPNQERRMHVMLASPRLDLAAGAEEMEMHRPTVFPA
jgi:hypothetical protein